MRKELPGYVLVDDRDPWRCSLIGVAKIAAREQGNTHNLEVSGSNRAGRHRDGPAIRIGKHRRAADPGERQIIDDSSCLESRHGLNLPENLVVVGYLQRARIILARGPNRRSYTQRDPERENAIGPKTEVILLQANQAVNHEAGANQQGTGERGLRADEDGKQAGRGFRAIPGAHAAKNALQIRPKHHDYGRKAAQQRG